MSNSLLKVRGLKKYGFLFLLLGCFVALIFMAQEPDQTLYFYREIPTDLTPDRLDRNISALTRWPQWFHSLGQVSSLGGKSEIQTGAILKLKIDPHKGKRKQFDLTMQVTEYLPNKTLGLKLVDDSSGRLTRLFDQLEWKIQVEPGKKAGESPSNGSRIIGTAMGHTHNWKSRLFGRLSGKILMNQVFYPDLMKLAELRQPFSAELPPEPVGLSGSSQ